MRIQNSFYIVPVFIFTLFSGSLHAENLHDPAEYIGADIKTIYETWGIPDELASMRGEKYEWDTVVFYKDGCSLFFVQNVVWQLRYDSSFNGEWNGITIGTLYPVIDSILGRAVVMPDGSRIYSLTGYSLPIQVRCYFENDKLTDVYIYRSNGL